MLIKLIRSFSSAHRLPHYDGPCHDLHGHTWKAVFIIEGPVKPDGMVCDFKDDKQLLDDNPTAENLAQFLFTKIGAKLAGTGLKLKTLEIWESENAAAVVEG